MKFSAINIAALALGLASTAAAGAMERLQEMKIAQRESAKSHGVFAPGKYNKRDKQKCKNGKAGVYSCNNIDMTDFMSHEEMGSTTREGNDIWGWTAPNGREFAGVGQTDGTAFVEIKRNGALNYLGRLPTQTNSSIWRDMKVIDGYMYIGSEARGHGMQVFDMRKLLSVRKPKVFSTTTDLTAWFSFGGRDNSHNIVADEVSKMIYAVGTDRTLDCKAGLFMVDVSDPKNPKSPGCVYQDGYVHDAQCVASYKGPHKKYQGKPICFNFNEDTLTIVDMTIKTAPEIISRTPYVGAAYTHQGWLIDENDMSYILLDDELDELDRTGPAANNHTTTYIFDIRDLAAPVNTGYYQSPAFSIDHNQYVVDGLTYQANYGSGLRIVDVTSVSKDPTGASMKEVGFFDCYPEDDAVGGEVAFTGTWSVYPYFKSGFVLLNSIERGVFALKYTGKR
ncbi:hypothetical protein K402DRAFT_361352 [Aulographum hederae CBS 113979]|uniref:Regulatory P domain-containing protein n=1 Tax=Aulographum hederae CBS 113979 TaxID=1176131 RepID=A0A6G1GR98_9PEZI|nr:hypothetical protein K402DRAFT_361352 [Aulographum hederae CBS 113979]